MKKTFLGLAMVAIATTVLFSSCATLFGHSSYAVLINSEPSGAIVNITNKKNKEIFNGQTPATVTLKSSAGFFSKAEYQVKISSTGYTEQIIPVTFTLNGWYFGNILIGGLVGMLIVDPLTGAMWKLESPQKINATLIKTTASTGTPMLRIVDIASIPESMRSDLVRIK
ncbi:MAG: hypothetical protein ABIR78_03485 [Ferruginibacter sp.]